MHFTGEDGVADNGLRLESVFMAFLFRCVGFRMHATTEPFTGGMPELVVVEPGHRPRDNGLGDRTVRRPLAVVVETERAVVESVGDLLIVAVREGRVDDGYGWVAASAEADFDLILRAEWTRLQGPPPDEFSTPPKLAELWVHC
jgi:hypothetical protein